MKSSSLLSFAFTFAVSAISLSSVWAADVYQVNASVLSGGLDLVGGGYATDALKVPVRRLSAVMAWA